MQYIFEKIIDEYIPDGYAAMRLPRQSYSTFIEIRI